jgi:hypothetical protein
MPIHWNRQEGLFYLHKDEWAMIDLLPAENLADLLRTTAEAKTFGEEHFGTKYELVLVDWWKDIIIDLRDRTGVTSYLEASSQQDS